MISSIISETIPRTQEKPSTVRSHQELFFTSDHSLCTNNAASLGFIRTHLAEQILDRLSLMDLRYSDGLIRWFAPSEEVPLGKLGGTKGSTSCLFTRFGPPGLDTGLSPGAAPPEAAVAWPLLLYD